MNSFINTATLSILALALTSGSYAGTDSGGGCDDNSLCDVPPSPIETEIGSPFEPIGLADPSTPISPGDTDLDGVLDVADNCTTVANPDQRDTDGDGFGNVCDADLDNDCSVQCSDLSILQSQFYLVGELASDFNGDLTVNSSDLGIFRQYFFSAPGPSGIATQCD